MATATDFNKMMQDMLGAFPVDTKAMQDMFKSQAAMNERMSKVVLEAAEKSAEVSNKWTKQTLAKIGEVSTVKAEPADYSKAMTDFASTSAEIAAEHMAAYAEIAKRVQMDTVELMMAAGKDFSAEATAAVQKATSDMTAAAKKAGDEVASATRKAHATAK
ncbi:MAG: Glucose signaling factor 2 [Rhodobacteraceae bacterium HLUCCA12]|nr:MAG: Glucose signaling factor 2 [Rhodobacteraceae bacterium HLUCCA12]